MIVFDPAKDEANIAKHGVSLRLAEEMDLASAFVRQDNRRDYQETRFNAYGYVDGRLYALTFTVRGADVRAISLRRARTKELIRWRSES